MVNRIVNRMRQRALDSTQTYDVRVVAIPCRATNYNTTNHVHRAAGRSRSQPPWTILIPQIPGFSYIEMNMRESVRSRRAAMLLSSVLDATVFFIRILGIW